MRIKAFLREICEYCVTRNGVRHCINGGALGVDTWAMEVVIDLKAAYPTITLECARPVADMPAESPAGDRARYHRLVDHIDTVTVIAPRCVPGCMRQRNQLHGGSRGVRYRRLVRSEKAVPARPWHLRSCLFSGEQTATIPLPSHRGPSRHHGPGGPGTVIPVAIRPPPAITRTAAPGLRPNPA
ncbi:MAG: SLOG family protein [Planctomycetes bacterium]|nr:SLOG family protein [Planctomycetota bacterium]